LFEPVLGDLDELLGDEEPRYDPVLARDLAVSVHGRNHRRPLGVPLSEPGQELSHTLGIRHLAEVDPLVLEIDSHRIAVPVVAFRGRFMQLNAEFHVDEERPLLA